MPPAAASSRILDMPLDVLDDHDRIVHDDACGQDDGKERHVLIEKSRRCTNANAPTRDTGSVSAGMSVARQLWRNRNITSTTRRIATPSVSTTSRIDS